MPQGDRSRLDRIQRVHISVVDFEEQLARLLYGSFRPPEGDECGRFPHDLVEHGTGAHRAKQFRACDTG